MKKDNTDCLWNNLCDSGSYGLCDSAAGAYSIIPGDCPCDDYVKRNQKLPRQEQIIKQNQKKAK